MTTLSLIYLQIVLHYVTLTRYYVIKPCSEDNQSQHHKSIGKKQNDKTKRLNLQKILDYFNMVCL